MSEPHVRTGLPARMTAEAVSYARASAEDQKLDLQRDALERAGFDRICRASGPQRPGSVF